ncbi:hypothetical protein N7491_006116 [Penicillium cf. griseofulvum]|uniref:Shugoshin n=1 Tax=Penicillium cf. griseofulvum TaxID=2972120 RepID=A0A9W9IVV5_9EURO|nr:hypothetical protein N7472_010853 [Penicillium cf. griseofulvum]KAJ5429100.1 hypothetical protein N7491_006116 [Penicillium cf. griseofulvum]KAJ5437106.1 hypothetical protein N7445_007991 [Penicillium cf. griseofulvum]
MARLNDYPAPAESIDALKRRFVRQNREIARVNSLQSLRIRSLESEVSHLLSENVSLRKQVINLTQETERLEAGKLLHNGIYDIKSKLDAKLAELSNLAADLGSLPRKVGKLCDHQLDRPKQAAESRPRTEDMMGGENGRLPAIIEDKYYPRQTLESQELDSLIHSDHSILDSPPQFSFMPEEGDAPIDHSSPSPPETTFRSQINNDTPGESEPLLPPTLETRKKKKKSISMIAPEISPAPTDRQPSPPISTTQHAASVSTKRKYIPEDDDRFTSNLNIDDDEFQFTRPSHSPKTQMNPFEDAQRDQSPTKSDGGLTRGSKPPVLSMRKVLEPKSANSNLGSPKKARTSSYKDANLLQRPTKGDENKNSPQKVKDVEKLGGKTINQKPRVARIAPSNKEKRASRPAHPQLEEPAPRQPALSPHPNAMNTEEESAIRPSRRRGAVVSYAEPNLRDKMRRPTKEMIDAVALGSRRSSSFQTGQESLDGGDGGHTQSHGRLPADFTLAAQSSDQFSVNGSSEQLLAMVSRRKRKVSATPKDDSDAGETSSDLKNDLKKEIEDSLADISAQVSQESLNSRRQTRRHSSNPKSTTASMAQYEVDQAEPQSPIADSPEDEGSFGLGPNGSIMDTSHVRRGQRVAARRKSMMV